MRYCGRWIESAHRARPSASTSSSCPRAQTLSTSPTTISPPDNCQPLMLEAKFTDNVLEQTAPTDSHLLALFDTWMCYKFTLSSEEFSNLLICPSNKLQQRCRLRINQCVTTSELCIWNKNKILQWMTLVVLSTIPKH